MLALVMLQFSFTNSDVVPPSIKKLELETPEEKSLRKSHANGIVLISPTENVSLREFPADLTAASYEMVDAFYKPRLDKFGRTYHMVRFLFAHPKFANISDAFKQSREAYRRELQEICEKALWRARGFWNPFFKNGERDPNHDTVSFNLEARKPLYLPDGRPVVVWQKNEAGQRLGLSPLPLKADLNLHFQREGWLIKT